MATASKSVKKTAKQVQPAPAPKARKPKAAPAPEPVTETKNQIGQNIQAAMTATLMTVEQIAAKTGYTVARVQEHVNYEISKNRSKLNGKKQVVVVSQPVRRNHG